MTLTRVRTIAFISLTEMARRKDAYVLFILLSTLLITLTSADIFGIRGAVGYIKDVGLLATWCFTWILSVTVSCRQLTQEESRGTIVPLLTKPITRGDLILGKWVGAWSVVCACALCFYAVLSLVVVLWGGAFDKATLAQAYLLHMTVMGIICAISLLFTARLNHDAGLTLSFVLTGAAFMIVPRIPAFAVGESAIREASLIFLYCALPHIELFDMRRRLVHDFGAAPWGSVGVVFAYGVVLTALFLVMTWLAYRNKRFSKEAVG